MSMNVGEVLKTASAEMMANARAATSGPWYVTHDPIGVHVENGSRKGRICEALGRDRGEDGSADARFIAGMDPHVACMVALWLNEEAEEYFSARAEGEEYLPNRAFKVATAFLSDPRISQRPVVTAGGHLSPMPSPYAKPGNS